MSMLRLNESSPLVQAYYKKKKEEEERQKRFQEGLIDTPKATTPMQHYQAKGRLKEGQLNKTEKRYQEYLEAEKHAGRIKCYWFESLKVKIAEGTCWYTPDFLVMRPDGTLEFHEVKACPRMFMDDAKVKVKATATIYPFKMIVVYPERNGWKQVSY